MMASTNENDAETVDVGEKKVKKISEGLMIPPKKPEQSKAERRALREQQRAAKAAGKDWKEAVKDDDKPIKKVHHVTVAMVPPPEHAPQAWKVVSQMRRQLKDPGYYRWPPHANLLYPFLNISPTDDATEVLEQLHSATRQIEPFPVRLQELGTFGGKQRGVLWLKPDSSSDDCGEPLLALHKKLEEAFPMCLDQTKGGSFTPHMTLSHFINLQDALTAKETVETDYKQELESGLCFQLDRVYLLHRQGDEGQFLRTAEIGLGKQSQVTTLCPPQPFAEMPSEEEEWVYRERMQLKARRNNNSGRSRGGRRKQQKRRELRVPDTPEQIAAKRAARKAKRERLEQEQQQEEGSVQD